LNGSRGLEVEYESGEIDAGILHLSFGRNPNTYMQKGIRDTEDFRDVYYRFYYKLEPNWQGNPTK
jgi:hypothetical protein